MCDECVLRLDDDIKIQKMAGVRQTPSVAISSRRRRHPKHDHGHVSNRSLFMQVCKSNNKESQTHHMIAKRNE